MEMEITFKRLCCPVLVMLCLVSLTNSEEFSEAGMMKVTVIKAGSPSWYADVYLPDTAIVRDLKEKMYEDYGKDFHLSNQNYFLMVIDQIKNKNHPVNLTDNELLNTITYKLFNLELSEPKVEEQAQKDNEQNISEPVGMDSGVELRFNKGDQNTRSGADKIYSWGAVICVLQTPFDMIL